MFDELWTLMRQLNYWFSLATWIHNCLLPGLRVIPVFEAFEGLVLSFIH